LRISVAIIAMVCVQPRHSISHYSSFTTDISLQLSSALIPPLRFIRLLPLSRS
jgi:hypothetical protein